MHGRVDEELFVKQDNHILDGAKHFRLDSEGTICFAKPDERAENICQGN